MEEVERELVMGDKEDDSFGTPERGDEADAEGEGEMEAEDSDEEDIPLSVKSRRGNGKRPREDDLDDGYVNSPRKRCRSEGPPDLSVPEMLEGTSPVIINRYRVLIGIYSQSKGLHDCIEPLRHGHES